MKPRTTNHEPRTILITGSSGFIGTNLVEKLSGDNNLILLDLLPSETSQLSTSSLPRVDLRNASRAKLLGDRNFETYVSDIRSGIFDEIFSNHQVDAVIHLAGKAGVRPSLIDPKLYFDVNVMGTLNLLESMKKYQVKKLVFASSSSIYGNRANGPFNETDITDSPISPYGASKKAAEVLINSYAHLYGINSVCLRFFTVYGPNNRPDLAIFKFMDAIANDQQIEKFGDGNTGRDYTFVEDTVDGIIKSLDLETNFEIINLGNSKPVLLNDMIRAIEAVVGKKATIIDKPMQPGDVELTFANITKAQDLLNWQPKVGFQDGILKMWKWYKEINSHTN